MKVNFNDAKKELKVKETKALIMISIPALFKNIENKKNRGDWYRKFLGINNALFISKDVGHKTETLIIFDAKKSQCNDDTKLIFTENGGASGNYILPVLPFWALLSNADYVKEQKLNIIEIKEMLNHITLNSKI